MSKENNQNSGPTKKQILALVVLFSIAIGLFLVYISDFKSQEEMPPIASSQPIELQSGVVGNKMTSSTDNNITSTTNEPEQAYMKEDIDRYFSSLLKNQKPLTPSTNAVMTQPLNAASGVNVKLPELKQPTQMQRMVPSQPLAPPPVMNGQPTPLSMAPTFQAFQIRGVACDSGVCKANTSVGTLSKGSNIGGGMSIVEHVEMITMAGVKTDKRFISY